MTTYEPRCVLKIGAELGEHPVWSAEGQCLYWLDIEKRTINRFDPATGGNQAWSLPSRPGCFVMREDGSALVALQDGFYAIDFATGSIEQVVPAAHDPALLRYNDGRADRQGRFWVSTVRADMNLADTGLNGWYRLDRHGLEPMLGNVGVPNGTAFSPDGRILYRAKTDTGQVFRHDYDPETGTASNEQLLATLTGDYGLPDGATVDDQGAYWVAIAAPPGGQAATGGVARFTPDGRLDRYIHMPVPFVTMPAFGGPDMSTLYVTTARLEAFMPGQVPPGAGDLYAIETDCRGVPESLMGSV